MKTLRFIGMALSAVILSVNFAACSDDDEDVQGGDTSITQKYIVSQTFLNSFPHMSGSEHSATASYDENNRLSRINDMSNSMGDDYDGWDKATIIFDYDNFIKPPSFLTMTILKSAIKTTATGFGILSSLSK